MNEWNSAADQLAALAAGRASALDLVSAAISRIEALDGGINAVICRRFDAALLEARQADDKRARGETAPLLGLPITVKESYNVAGLPSTWGFEAPHHATPHEDAAAVARLRAAGAILLGKTNVPTDLADWQSYNPVYGTTNNPFDPARTPGGSSGGSAAALAAGFVAAEMGSDIGGSLRVPAHFCGVYAHAPSLDLVPVRGHVPPGVPAVPRRSDLAVVGPMARSAEDLELLLDVVAGPDGPAANSYRLQLPPARFDTLAGCRVLVLSRHPLVATGTDMTEAIDNLVERLAPIVGQLEVDPSAMPDLALGARTYMQLLTAGAAADRSPARTAEQMAKAAALSDDDDSLQAMRIRGSVLSHADWLRADRIRVGFRKRWSDFFRDWDIVVCPAFAVPAFPHDHNPRPRTLHIDGHDAPYEDQLAWPAVSTLPGLPATALPVGQTASGLPIGVQAIGPMFEDRTTIAFAHLLEREFGGFVQPPPLRRAS